METFRICIDTDIIIDFTKDRLPGVEAFIKSQEQFICFTTSISVYELFYGVEYTQKIEYRKQMEEIIGFLEILPFDLESAKVSARIDAYLSKEGRGIGVKDTLISGICIANQIPLLTKNKDHFSRVPDLVVVLPEEIEHFSIQKKFRDK